MTIQPFTLGFGYTNTYVIYFDNKKAYLVDAPDSIDPALDFIESEGLELEAVLLTHGHYDHILGLPRVRSVYDNIDIFLDAADFCFIEDGAKANIDILQGQNYILDHFKKSFDSIPNDIKPYGNTFNEFEIIRTPGHTLGSICLYSQEEKIIFSGDTIFKDGIGRWDLGGDYSSLLESIDKLKALPDETIVFPGHGNFTSIREEKQSNPYF